MKKKFILGLVFGLGVYVGVKYQEDVLDIYEVGYKYYEKIRRFLETIEL